MMLHKTFPWLLGLALLAPAPALAESGSGDETTVEVGADYLAYRRPPPAYRPARRPYVRPAPRRVYVAPAYAPRPRRAVELMYEPMFHLGIGVHGTSVFADSDSGITNGLASGAGFDVGFGWRVAPSFSLDFNWMMSFHDAGEQSAGPEAALMHFSMDGRFFLTDRSRQTQPYILAGIGAYILGRDSWEFDTLSGIGFQLGGGVDFFISKHVSIGGKLLYRGAYLDNAESSWPGFPTETAWLSAFSYGGDLKFHF